MAATPPVTVERIEKADEALAALAALRMEIFRDWPYLYDGNQDYEERYLRDFLGGDGVSLVVARAGDRPVGMATAGPLANQSIQLTEPLARAGIPVDQCFYFGESVLLPHYRGVGIDNKFFDEREACAREAGACLATFCAVMREADHPLRPASARDLSPFWRKRGYARLDGVSCTMDWREIGRSGETTHRMQFWTKSLSTSESRNDD